MHISYLLSLCVSLSASLSRSLSRCLSLSLSLSLFFNGPLFRHLCLSLFFSLHQPLSLALTIHLLLSFTLSLHTLSLPVILPVYLSWGRNALASAYQHIQKLNNKRDTIQEWKSHWRKIRRPQAIKQPQWTLTAKSYQYADNISQKKMTFNINKTS